MSKLMLTASCCRLSVKTLVEKSCFGHADEQGKEVQNFLVILEHVLSHRLKGTLNSFKNLIYRFISVKKNA